MNVLADLLDKVQEIVIKDNLLRKEKEEKGDYFNIFEILNLSKYEEKLHTPFISELLNPTGSHGLNSVFLRAFFDRAKLDLDFDFESASVKSEFNIGYITKDRKTGGRIDIFIQDKYKNSIIIENKIYADDQVNQLLRYENYAKSNQLNYRLLYLTLDGARASNKAVGSRNINYECISYRETILNWLEDCVVLSSEHPLIRETMKQYITNLKMLLNIMDKNSSDELIRIATSKEYFEAALSIISNSWEIEVEIRKQFIDSLKGIAERNNLIMECDKELCELVNESYIYFYNRELSEKWAIIVGADKHTGRDGGVYFGITYRTKPVRMTKKQLLEINKLWYEGDQTSTFPFGWGYLRGENGQGNWWDWSDIDTLKDMVNGKLAYYIENEIIKPVMSNRLLEKIEDSTNN